MLAAVETQSLLVIIVLILVGLAALVFIVRR